MGAIYRFRISLQYGFRPLIGPWEGEEKLATVVVFYNAAKVN